MLHARCHKQQIKCPPFYKTKILQINIFIHCEHSTSNKTTFNVLRCNCLKISSLAYIFTTCQNMTFLLFSLHTLIRQNSIQEKVSIFVPFFDYIQKIRLLPEKRFSKPLKKICAGMCGFQKNCDRNNLLFLINIVVSLVCEYLFIRELCSITKAN